MIKIDINTFFCCLVVIPLAYFFIKEFLFLRVLDAEVEWLGNSAYIVCCPFCTHVYFDYINKDVSRCSQCESFITIANSH